MATLEELDTQIAELEGQISTAMEQGGGSPDYSAFYKSPGYQFRFDEGQRALETSAAARGGRRAEGRGRSWVRWRAGRGWGRRHEPETRGAAGGAATGSKQPLPGTGLDPSFRSGLAVRFEGLCARAAQSRREDLDEPQGPAAGQRSCGKLFQDFENGGSRMQRVGKFGRGAGRDRRLY